MEDRLRTLILGVAREALRESGARGLILVTPPCPEARLLARWCREGELTLEEPDPELAASLEGVLLERVDGADERRARAEARRAAARIRGDEGRLIPVAAVNRTALLLSPAPPPEPFLPLGDVSASQVVELEGTCTLPPPFRELSGDPDLLRSAEAYLDGLRRGTGASGDDGGPDPELRRRLERAVAAGSWWRRVPPLVPKLEAGTWGIDLDL